MLEMVNTGHQSLEGLKTRKETYNVILGCSGKTSFLLNRHNFHNNKVTQDIQEVIMI